MAWDAVAGPIGTMAPGATIAYPAQPRNDGPTRAGAYKNRFPVGVVIDEGAIGSLKSVWIAETRKLIAAGLFDVLAMNVPPLNETAGINGPAHGIEAESPAGEVKFVPFVNGTITNNPNPIDGGFDGINNGWYPLTVGAQTVILANYFADAVQDIYDQRPCILAYMLGDDLVETSTIQKPSECAKLITAFKARDLYDRPGLGTYRDDDLGYTFTPTADRAVFAYSHYPYGVTSAGTDARIEGDLHNYNQGGVQVDQVRAKVASRLPGERVFWHAQVHQTKEDINPTGPWDVTTRTYPTPREMQKWFWQLIGEGITGIYWFTWTSAVGTDVSWDGLGHPNSVARLSMATSLAQRLNPGIRQRLIPCVRDTTDRWTVTGGGSTGLPVNDSNAYASTLHDAESDVYYLVVVNHSANTANITVAGTSGFTVGTLVNLESGLETDVGAPVSLPGFDGSIWKYDPTGDMSLVYSWADLGTDSVIAAKGGQSDQIHRMTWWQGMLFLGYGNINEAPRPLPNRYWDSSDSTYKSLGTDLGADANFTHWIHGNKLWVFATDPADVAPDSDYALITTALSVSIHNVDPPITEHAWHAATFSVDGNLYVAGSVTATERGTVWRTTDGGTTWTTVQTAATANYHWYCFIFELGGKLWVQAYKATATQGMQGNAFSSTNGTTWVDSGIKVLPTGSAAISGGRSIVFQGSAFVVSDIPQGFNGKLYKFGGTVDGVDVSTAAFPGEAVYDICSNGTTLYAITNADKVWRTTDGTAWTLLSTVPDAFCASIEVDGTNLYVGTHNSKVWKGTLT